MRATSEIDALSRRIAFLRRVPLFANLAESDLRILVNDLRSRTYKKGTTIFRQGDTGCDLYLIAEGKVRIFRVSPAGNETSISIFSAGDTIGELAAIDCQPRSATATALENCTLLEMTQEHFLQRMREMPDLAIGIARLLAHKVRWASEYAETIAQYDAAGRLLHILLVYNQEFGREIEAGKRYELDLSLNQTDLASLVGARREWVNRILQHWHQQGLVKYKAGKLLILDLPRVVKERDSQIEANRQKEEW